MISKLHGAGTDVDSLVKAKECISTYLFPRGLFVFYETEIYAETPWRLYVVSTRRGGGYVLVGQTQRSPAHGEAARRHI